MRHTARSSFFIRDLTGCDLRQAHPGTIGVASHISAVALADAAISSSHRRLAESIHLGETAQAVRSAEGLYRASQNILGLPLGKVADCIGRYYQALFLNRQGPAALAEADKILTDVADHGPLLFRSKACVAMATNRRFAGDDKAALEIYAEAARIAEHCEHGTLHPLFWAAFQSAVIKNDEGDHRGALADIEKLEPLARQIGLELPAVLHVYCNNLAAALIANGRGEEASRFSRMLLTSPFRTAFPEWRRTCADIAKGTQPSSRSLVLITEPFTGEPEALTAPVTLAAGQRSVEYHESLAPLVDGAAVSPESFNRSLGEAERSHLATDVDAQLPLVESSVTHPVAPARAAAVSPSTAAVSLSVPATARWAARALGIAAAFQPLKARQISRRTRIELFSGRLSRHLSIAARDRAPSPRSSHAQLRPPRWSYFQLCTSRGPPVRARKRSRGVIPTPCLLEPVRSLGVCEYLRRKVSRQPFIRRCVVRLIARPEGDRGIEGGTYLGRGPPSGLPGSLPTRTGRNPGLISHHYARPDQGEAPALLDIGFLKVAKSSRPYCAVAAVRNPDDWAPREIDTELRGVGASNKHRANGGTTLFKAVLSITPGRALTRHSVPARPNLPAHLFWGVPAQEDTTCLLKPAAKVNPGAHLALTAPPANRCKGVADDGRPKAFPQTQT
jgi:hypothetical protein